MARTRPATTADGDGAAAGRDWVALTLAAGLATALNALTLAAILDAVLSDDPGLSENATQIISGAFGGVLGVLGSYVGYRAGRADATPPPGQGQSVSTTGADPAT